MSIQTTYGALYDAIYHALQEFDHMATNEGLPAWDEQDMGSWRNTVHIADAAAIGMFKLWLASSGALNDDGSFNYCSTLRVYFKHDPAADPAYVKREPMPERPVWHEHTTVRLKWPS